MSMPALCITSFTHLDIVLFDTGPNGFIVLISSFEFVRISLVRDKYSERIFTMHNFLSFKYFWKTSVSKCFPGLDCFNNPDGAIKTLSLAKLISVVSIEKSVWHL